MVGSDPAHTQRRSAPLRSGESPSFMRPLNRPKGKVAPKRWHDHLRSEGGSKDVVQRPKPKTRPKLQRVHVWNSTTESQAAQASGGGEAVEQEPLLVVRQPVEPPPLELSPRVFREGTGGLLPIECLDGAECLETAKAHRHCWKR